MRNCFQFSYPYLNVRIVTGRYDLCDLRSQIFIPQKSLEKILKMFVFPRASSLVTIADMSSCTKSPCKLLPYTRVQIIPNTTQCNTRTHFSLFSFLVVAASLGALLASFVFSSISSLIPSQWLVQVWHLVRNQDWKIFNKL